MTTPGVPTLAPAAYFAVDTFFWVGGFLVTIGMLEQVKKISKLSKFFLGSVLHRFVRIWPTYMMAILIYWKVAPFFGSGPIWNTFYNFSSSCDNGGVLWNMFFLDNFENHGPNGLDYCFGWVNIILIRDGTWLSTSNYSSFRPSSCTLITRTKKLAG